jgi:hypothetical protein
MEKKEEGKMFWLNPKLAEFVRHRVSLPLRVKSISFPEDQVCEKEKKYDDDDVSAYKKEGSQVVHLLLVLPRPVIHIGKKMSISGADIRGITELIDRKFYQETAVLPGSRKRASDAKRTGIFVDKELKDFAKGHLQWHRIQREETKAIVEYLFSKNISLLSSAVIVTNYEKYKERRSFSGTEIDLVGFDHIKRKYVVIEVKCTSKYFPPLLAQNRSAAIEKKSGFKKSILGRYAAQLTCTTVMFRHTYPTVNCYALLIICEIGACKCHTVEVKECLIDGKRFSGWLAGF